MSIAILMSTYNGESYLSEQLQSIVRQSSCDWELFIRDDGSTDNTLSIINEFQRKDGRIHFVDDDLIHLGPSESFLSLILSVNADYYILCDQDDVWYPQKIEILYSEISRLDKKVPLLIYSGIQTINKENQHVKSIIEKSVGSLSKPIERFFWNDMPGCTVMFNELLRNKLDTSDKDSIVMHDWWLAIIAQTFGQIKFIPKKLIYYRLHDSNSVGSAPNFIERLAKGHLLERAGQRINLQMKQSKYFLEKYGKEDVPKKTKRFLIDISRIESMNISQRMKFLMVYRPKRKGIVDTVSLSIWILLKIKHER